MLALFTDELTRSSAELREPEGASQHSWHHLESQAALIEPSLRTRQNVISQIEATFRVGRDWWEAKDKCTRRQEFTKFQAEQSITPAEGKKAMKVYQQFGNDWEQEKLLTINSAVSLATLCQPKFAAAVQQLREAANLTKEFVKNLVKEVRDAASFFERQKKPLTDPAKSGWRQDPSGGGRHYQLPPMYNEEAAMKVEAMAQERGVRVIAVVEEAIIAYSEQPTVVELKRQHQEEMQAAVTEMRGEHIRMQREIIELKRSAQTPYLAAPETHNFSTWVEFVDTVECDASEAGLPTSQARTTLLNTVKSWSLQDRQKLSVLLADYLSEDQINLDQVAWVPEKLLNSALSKLSFTVAKISGPDNMIDEAEIEEINGCRFVSVQHLGTRHQEQWMFEGYGGRKLSVFGRDDFKIEPTVEDSLAC